MMQGVTANSSHLPPVPRALDGDLPPDESDAQIDLLADLAALTLPLMWSLRQASVRALEPLNLRPAQGLVIGLIGEGVSSPKSISDFLSLAPSMVSGILGDLEDRGLVVRQPDPEDRRRVHLVLSDEGTAAAEGMAERWTAVTRERLGHLSEDDLTTLVRIYRSFIGHA